MSAVGCDDDHGPSEPLTYAQLSGTWVLLSLVFTSDANPAVTYDFRGRGGSGSLQFAADTTFVFTIVPDPGSPAESDSGPVGIQGNTVVLTADADPDLPLLSGSLIGGQLRLNTDDAEYDFDGDGTDDPARVSAIFVR